MSPPRNISAVLCLVAALIFEAGAALLLWGDALWWGALSAHLTAACLCGEGLCLRCAASDPQTGKASLRTGWLLGITQPLFGPLLVATVAFSPRRQPQWRTAAASMEKRRFQAAEAALEVKRNKQVIDGNLDPLVDALEDRDRRVRIAAMDTLRGDSSKRAVKTMARSRTNADFDVRLRAVEGLGRISKEYGDKINAARARLDQDSSAPDGHLELARLCVEYADLAIEDASTTGAYLERAIRHVEIARNLGAGDEAALVAAKALRGQRRYAQAEGAYRTVLNTDRNNVEALVGVAEMQFYRRDFASLRSTSRWVLREVVAKVDAARRESLAFWIREA